MTKERYNELFHNMIVEGLCQGLLKPSEYLSSFDRGFCCTKDELKERDIFMNRAIVDVYSNINCTLLTFEEANKLYDKDLNG